MRNWKILAKKLIPLAGAALLATACGGSYTETNLTPTDRYSSNNPLPSNLPGSDPGQPTTSPVDTTFKSSYPIQQFEITGNGGNYPIWPKEDSNMPDGFPVVTDSKLRIRISARSAGNVSLPTDSKYKYSNTTAAYYCVSYVIQVNGATVGTKVLSTNGTGSELCPYASTSQVIDVSAFLSPGSDEPVMVKVTGPRYDWYCAWLHSTTPTWWLQNYGYSWQTYFNQVYNDRCQQTLSDVHRSHTVRGAIEFETNTPQID